MSPNCVSHLLMIMGILGVLTGMMLPSDEEASLPDPDNEEVVLPSDVGSSFDGEDEEEEVIAKEEAKPKDDAAKAAKKSKRRATNRKKQPVIPGPSRQDLLKESAITVRDFALWSIPVPKHMDGTLPDDIMELYSPPRVSAHSYSAAMGGAVCGRVLRGNLSVDIETGWNMVSASQREEVMIQVKARRPTLVTLSPPCTYMSTLQNLNWAKMAREKREAAFREACLHVDFCMVVADWQHSRGRKFMFEHPRASLSWSRDTVQYVAGLPGSEITTFDMCYFGLVSKETKTPVLKATQVLTNMVELADELRNKKCPGHDKHQILQGYEGGQSRSSFAQVYPDMFCAAVTRALLAFYKK